MHFHNPHEIQPYLLVFNETVRKYNSVWFPSFTFCTFVCLVLPNETVTFKTICRVIKVGKLGIKEKF